MNQAEMELHFSPCTLRGTIRYTLDPGTDAFFILDDRFQITELTDDAGKELHYQKSPDSRPFCRQSCYTPKPSNTGKYTIKFESSRPFHQYPTQRKRSDRYNFFGEDRIILYDNYLCFFPRLDFPDSSTRISGRPIPCVYEPLTAYGLEDYKVYFSEKMQTARAPSGCPNRTAIWSTRSARGSTLRRSAASSAP